MKLIVQVKLRPSAEQSAALMRTLETTNRACNRLSALGWEAKEFRQIPLHRLGYRILRDEFPLSAQIVIRAIAKVADAYKLDRERQRVFREHGAISYDLRVLRWNMSASSVSIWTVAGRQKIPFVCGEHQRKLLGWQKGETDLVYRNREWYLFTTVDIPDIEEREAFEWLGVDMGVVSIANTSDGTRFAGGQLNGLRARHRRLRRKLQAKGTRSAKRLLRKRRLKEARFARSINHKISKDIVSVAERTERGIALENLKHIRKRIRAQRKQRSRLHSWAFGELQAFVSYKAKRAGVPVKFVDARNTSRTCAECGFVDKRNRKTQSLFECRECGHRANADANAARNISRRAVVNPPNATSGDGCGVHRVGVRDQSELSCKLPALAGSR